MKTTPLSLRLSPELYARLEDCAKRLRQKKHSLAQEAIEAAVEAIEKNDYRLVVPIAFEVTHIPIQKIQPAPAKSSSQSRAIGKQILQTVKSHHSKSGAGQLGDPPGGPK